MDIAKEITQNTLVASAPLEDGELISLEAKEKQAVSRELECCDCV